MTAAATVAAFSVLLACTPATPVPEPVPAQIPVAPDPAVDSLGPDDLPAFRAGQLVRWGPAPGSAPLVERERTFDLRHQLIDIRLDWQRRAVVGSTTLRVAPLPGRALETVVLDAVGMRIIAVRGFNTALRHQYDGRHLTIELGRTLSGGSTGELTVQYETVDPAAGAYFIQRRRVFWTQGQPDHTSYWVPTYDFPNDRTTWEIRVRAPRGQRVLSNGRFMSTRDVGSEVEWRYAMQDSASTYLMSVVAGDYVVLQDVWRGIPIGHWTYPDSVPAGWRGMGETPDMVEIMSALTRVAYPYPKYDHSVVPDFIFGGMENVTATTNADDRILVPVWATDHVDPSGLVAHELAHQWFGDLVTTRNWSHAWLNEGFATFLEHAWREIARGEDAGTLARYDAREAVLAADRIGRRPLVYDRATYGPLDLFFTGHLYAKGSFALHMLRRELGDSLFWHGMNRYIETHAHSNVVTDDFMQAMQRATGRDLRRFFAQWVNGAGYPALRVGYSYDERARSVAIRAVQVQPRDSLTGWFSFPVAVAAMTDSGTVSGIAQLRDSITTVTLQLRAPPRALRWDAGAWLLGMWDFPRPARMLAHQLEHDGDVAGRLEAVALLSDLLRQEGATADAPDVSDSGVAQNVASAATRKLAAEALARAATRDSVRAVRALAVTALARAGEERDSPGIARAVLAASRDRDARVRERAAATMSEWATSATGDSWLARLSELAASDSSAFVRNAALPAYVRMGGPPALSLVDRMLARPSWRELDRAGALGALAAAPGEAAWPRAMRYLDSGQRREVKLAAMSTLARHAAGDSGRTAELMPRLTAMLDDYDLPVRIGAAGALGALRARDALPVLQRRRAMEPHSRALAALDAAIAAVSATRAGDQ